MTLFLVGLLSAMWCFCHSLFITHWWDRQVRRWFPQALPAVRAAYVAGSTLSWLALMLWIRSLPEQPLWSWPGAWSVARWAGLGLAGFLFWAGARAYDNRTFLGLSQLDAWLRGRPAPQSPFCNTGILGWVRHPWYTGSLVFFVCCLPYTDVNLVWRGVFFAYVLIGTELEERKLLLEIGPRYADYRRRVGRFIPRTWRSRRPR